MVVRWAAMLSVRFDHIDSYGMCLRSLAIERLLITTLNASESGWSDNSCSNIIFTVVTSLSLWMNGANVDIRITIVF